MNVNKYNIGIIYPSWATFVKRYQNPQGNKKDYFATTKETMNKDAQRAYSVL